jgi:hypothetical protein
VERAGGVAVTQPEPLTVEKLIEKLRDAPPKAKVLVLSDKTFFVHYLDVELDYVVLVESNGQKSQT